ncbi:hypothetical protein [Streptomyces sp. NPDC096132]|uniref:Lsr2 family DNA-binding protein n=1 Tax=Streptomyces sp. NPDC096132 TaxID=3366075 RepID=UPI003802A940
MTIAALRRLLDEIDEQGGPEAARQNRLHLPDNTQEGTSPMAQPIPQLPPADHKPALAPTEAIPVGHLLKWGDEHPDADVRDQAARARIALTGLRRRHVADQELAAVTAEAEQLEKRLAELRAREAELAPTKPKRKPPARDYDTRTVRAWAAEQGVECPRVGQIPKRVLDAWRASLPQAG